MRRKWLIGSVVLVALVGLALWLTRLLQAPESPVRRAALIAIRKIDPEAAARLGLPGLLALP